MIIVVIILLINFSLADLLQPTNNAMLNYTHVLFEWDQEPNAASYNFQLSTSENFNSIIVDYTTPITIFIDHNMQVFSIQFVSLSKDDANYYIKQMLDAM